MTTEALTINGKLLLTEAECAKALSMSVSTFRRKVRLGDFPAAQHMGANGPTKRMPRWRATDIVQALDRLYTI